MQYGAHLPLIDFDGSGWRRGGLTGYAGTARALGYEWLSVNDHLVFQRPWLDGLIALASVMEASGDMGLATTVALPVVRGTAALAKAAAALDILSGGRLVLGVGPGSSRDDYDLAGVPFDQRWARFDRAVPELRSHLATATSHALRPPPSQRGGPPIWIASWGSYAGLRRVARFGDGWLASAYNTTPAQVVAARTRLDAALGQRAEFTCALATMWTYVTEDEREEVARLADLSATLRRPVEDLAGRVLVGPAARCAALVRAYAGAGVDRLFVWPLADAEEQLERFMLDVVPAADLPGPASSG